MSGQETPEGSMTKFARHHPMPYKGPAVLVCDDSFHGVDVHLWVESDGGPQSWEGTCPVAESLVSWWSRLVGAEVHIILPGLYVAEVIIKDLVYAGSGAATSRLLGKGEPPRKVKL